MGNCDKCPINYRDFSPMSSQLPQQPVRVVKGESNDRKYHILRFNTPTSLKLQEVLSENVTMTRMFDENSQQESINLEGEGSEYGWKSKQARLAHKYKVKAITEEQCPWELKDKNNKVYTGRKEGGITENSSYIIMREQGNGVYEAFPLEDWYTFTPKIRYTTLNDEEAEVQFKRRHKTQNHYQLMLQKRLHANLGIGSEYDTSDQLKMHDAEDLLGDSDDATDDKFEDPTQKRKKVLKKTKQKKDIDDEEMNREKDDEDNYDEHASHEVDYISESDSDDSIDINTEKPDTMKKTDGIATEEGKIFHDSDSEDEELDENGMSMKKLLLENGEDESGSDIDENSEEFKALLMKNKNATSKDLKRERSSTPLLNGNEPPNKKIKTEKLEGSSLTEENVWRYLARKPISTKELIAKFKNKKSKVGKKELVLKLSSILKKIAKQYSKDGKNYFVLKDECKNLYS